MGAVRNPKFLTTALLSHWVKANALTMRRQGALVGGSDVTSFSSPVLSAPTTLPFLQFQSLEALAPGPRHLPCALLTSSPAPRLCSSVTFPGRSALTSPFKPCPSPILSRSPCSSPPGSPFSIWHTVYLPICSFSSPLPAMSALGARDTF